MTHTDRLLRYTLTTNGVFSIVSGSIAVAFNSVLADYMGVNQSVLIIVGIGTLLFGVTIIADIRRSELNPTQTRLTLFSDLMWVIAAVVLILGFPNLMTEAGNMLLASISVPVAIFALLQTLGLLQVQGKKHLVTHIEIEASPGDVWSVLTDIEAFEEWNPFIDEGTGKILEGSRLHLSMRTGDRRQMTIRPTVTVVEQNETLEWLGHLGPTGIFDGRHRFDLATRGDRTLLTQSEEFGGILVPFFSKLLDVDTRAGFERMNIALKRRVEEADLDGQF